MDFYRFKRHKHRVIGGAFDEAVFLQFVHIGVDIGVIASRGFGECIDGARAALAQGFEQIDTGGA